MLSVQSLALELGGRRILDGVSFVINPGEAAGIVGPNGSGKTSLLRAIAGELPPSSGRVELPPGARLGYLAQGHSGTDSITATEAFPAAFAVEDAPARLAQLSDRMAAHAASPAQFAPLEAEYDTLLSRISASPGVDLRALWDELGLREIAPATPLSALSGGELTKLGLIDLAAGQPDILLLDEPTNHLDIAGIEWVQRLIQRFPGPVVVVSHDRQLLDECVTQVIEIDPHTGRSETFAGDYTDYANERARREEEAWDAYRRQQREERALKRTISAIESRSRNIENRSINFYIRKRAKKVARRATTLKARLNRQLESAEHRERPHKAPAGFYGGFRADDGGSTRLLTAVDVGIEVAGRPLLERLTFVLPRGQKLVVTGPNGCGKTTLLRTILGERLPATGSLSLSGSAVAGYLAQADDIAPAELGLTPVQVLRRSVPMPESDAYNFLHRFLFGHDQVNTLASSLSYGERRRLALARLVLGGANLLLLDEPTNHLDLPSREAFEAALSGFEGSAIIVTHDRYFIEQFADEVLDLASYRSES